MVVRGVFASVLCSMSGLALHAVGATIASAATPSCEQSLSALTSNARVAGPLTDQDTSNNSSSATTGVDETLGGSLIESSAVVGALGAVSLAFGITGWRRRASRVDV
ncbi:hypothetical protein [Streptomyces tubercidicus]|uniref:hypothetical protein n=1 Tax=Streptomyces tubercidicus TaxID=47759 RepID=UPI0034669D99